MNNIKLTYLYRDAGNYKKWANVVFSNPGGVTAEAAKRALIGAFLQDGLFVARQIRIPEAFLFDRGEANSDDHCFNELDSVEATAEVATDTYSRSISQLIAEVKREAKRGWLAFDPHDNSDQQISD